MPKVSIVVPVFNAENYLDDCLSAILIQTLQDIEVILVDDGSSDNSGEMCDMYAESDPRIKVIHQKNYGVSYARNMGISVATGDYLGFVDSDDFIALDMFECLYDCASNYNADIAIVNMQVIYQDGKKSKVGADGEETLWNGSEDIITCFLRQNSWGVSANNKIYKKEIYKKVKFDDTKKINEDKLYCFQAILLAERVCKKNTPKYFYIKRLNSSSTTVFTAKYFDALIIGDKIEEVIKIQYPSLQVYARVNKIQTYLRIIKLLCIRNGRKEFAKEYIEIRNFLEKQSLSLCKQYLKTTDFIRLVLLRYFEVGFWGILKTIDRR